MFKFQNDFINYRLRGTDKYYTGGMGLGVFLEHKNKRHFVHQLTIDQKIFTPKNTNEKNRVAGDYPYASLLFSTYSILKVAQNKRGFIRVGVSFGTTGKGAGGEAFQCFVHRLIHDRKIEGWKNEVSLGNIFQVNLDAQQLAYKNSFSVLSVFTENTIGNIFNALALGLEFKFGNKDFLFLEHKTFLTPKKMNRLFYFFIRPHTSYVFKNKILNQGLAISTLTGGTSIKYPSEIRATTSLQETITKNRTTHLEAGFCIGGKRILFSLSQHWQSAEFTRADHHEFGEFTIIYLF